MKLALVALAASALALPAAAANLLRNGDFEAPITAPGTFNALGGGDSIPGWTVVGPPGNAVALVNTTYSEPGILDPAESGLNSMDLSGITNTGPTSGIFQNVSTVAGQTYVLGFWVGNADGSGNANYLLPSTVRLSVDGGPQQDFTNADTTFETVNWKFFSTSFVAAGGVTNIAFFNGTDLADADTGLDNVILDGPPGPPLGVPEPSQWALMILGFGLAGARIRRHAQAAH